MANIVRGWVDEGHIKIDTIEGLELLNEPAGFYDYIWEVCRDRFYKGGYETIREVFPESDKVLVSIQQAFRGYGDFDNFLPKEVITKLYIQMTNVRFWFTKKVHIWHSRSYGLDIQNL